MNLDRYTVNWNYPTNVKCGVGRVRDLPQLARSLGIKKPLLITDPGLATLSPVLSTMTLLDGADLHAGLFHQIKGNPTGQNVADGVAAYREGGFDGVIALGGGSALDAAKAVAMMVGQSGPLWDYVDEGDNWLRIKTEGMAPLVAIPTTAGTGSEVGRASVITHEAEHAKKIIFHPRMLPAIVILDPVLSTGLSAKLTAATGMDALSHSLEAYCSPFYHPMASGIALEGMQLVREWLPRAVADGTDLEARMQMLVASSMGATAFQRGLGAMHALAHPLGARFDAHHGMLNAILMPYVLKANQAAIDERITAAARYLGLPNPSFAAFLDWVLRLREEVGIPHTLKSISIDESCLETIGEAAVADGAHGTNPIPFTPQQYRGICAAALDGLL
ncbi:iron-containing alcohol dehydrogenase [Janthinobacterium sp. B9-8]|uniref:iron-containing alcohol dehydrogenase n=1 Tax=Janthinobacterium sp. B9-8 TaxID=1236179 RepID=UPI00061D1BEB|nr:iron-containing alcohol dehydrogenase [Janthinobacterium sp. B9-8]AMC33160.1 alcohol dehydrogenase [Janthinobacterium sp. B9-8]